MTWSPKFWGGNCNHNKLEWQLEKPENANQTKICIKYAWNMYIKCNIYDRYDMIMHEICMQYARNLQENMHEICWICTIYA
jgi:hypothetical protein